MGVGHLVHWGGVASCALGGIFYLVSLAKGKQARRLEAATPVEQLSDLKHLLDLLPLLVAVSGRVWSDKPLSCELADGKAVITKVQEEQQCMKQLENGEWVRDSQTVRQIVRETPWCLVDGTQVRLPVLEGRKAEGLPLEFVGDEFTDDHRNVPRKLVDNLLGLRVLGRKRTESVLPVGARVTAIGEMAAATEEDGLRGFPGVLHANGDVVVLQAPGNGSPFIITDHSLPQLVASLTSMSKACRTVAFGFGALGVCLIVTRIVRTTTCYLQQRRFRRRMEDARRLRQELLAHQGGNEDSDEDGELRKDACVVCYDQDCGAVFTACGHLCACWACASKLQSCPICRARSVAIKVYRT